MERKTGCYDFKNVTCVGHYRLLVRLAGGFRESPINPKICFTPTC